MSKKQKNKQLQILILVIISMLIIVLTWITWFFPTKQTNNNNLSGFKKFKQEIINSLSIFQNKPEKHSEVDVDNLRQRVFGDTIER